MNISKILQTLKKAAPEGKNFNAVYRLTHDHRGTDYVCDYDPTITKIYDKPKDSNDSYEIPNSFEIIGEAEYLNPVDSDEEVEEEKTGYICVKKNDESGKIYFYGLAHCYEYYIQDYDGFFTNQDFEYETKILSSSVDNFINSLYRLTPSLHNMR